MATYPQEAWERLGELLVSRRVELDVRFRNRRTFAATVELDYRVLYDIESTRRTNFTKSTLRAVEHAYGLVSGSLDRTLAGGPLERTQAAADIPADEPVVVEIPEDASPAERARLSAIQALLDAQQREINNLRSDVDELKRRHDGENAADDNGGRRSA